MIFVTVGTHNIGFERLIMEMDRIAGEIGEKMIMQIGSSNYLPKNADYFEFLDYETILEYITKSRIVISHAGAGTLLDILSIGKPVIVVPRLKQFNEAIDDQQLELAEMLENEGKAVAVYDIANLNDYLEKLTCQEYDGTSFQKSSKLGSFIKNVIRE